MTAGRDQAAGAFPYPSLPHPKHTPGGLVFPPMQIAMFPRLERFDVEHDLPEAFLPEFPPAMFLQNHPELGDVSRGEVVSINNFYRAVQGHHHAGAARRPPPAADAVPPGRIQRHRRPQEPPSPAWASPASTATSTATPPASSSSAPTSGPSSGGSGWTPPSLRGVFNQQIHGSKRSIRSVEDFTEFEQRTAYFNGDQIHAEKKGIFNIADLAVPHMAQCQIMLDFPPAPKLTSLGRLDPSQGAPRASAAARRCSSARRSARPATRRRSTSTTRCTTCTWSDSSNEPGDGPIKSFTLRGIKDSPPYMHDGRCLTLEDTVEFFNLVLN